MPDSPAPYVPTWSPRLEWTGAPAPIVEWVAAELGEPVVGATGQTGGFSSGIASVVRTASGRTALVKVAHAALNPVTPRMFRHEIAVNALLPAQAPVPLMRSHFDNGEWVGLLFDAVDGGPPKWPWTEPQLAATLDALALLRDTLTPAPAAAYDLPIAPKLLREDIGAGARLVELRPVELDPWTALHLDRLAGLADRVAVAGDTLVNFDVRADNTLIDRSGRAWIVDWSWGCVGAAFCEAVVLLVNAGVAGHDPQAWLTRSTAAAAPDQQVDAFLAMLIGMWAEAILLPEPVGTAGMRAFQRAHLTAAQRWLQQRWDGR
ncbi:MAG: aminoglycoside phosphotransferase family protein [Jatrophihabitans sp.]